MKILWLLITVVTVSLVIAVYSISNTKTAPPEVSVAAVSSAADRRQRCHDHHGHRYADQSA